ncbi:diacylglycerol/lipid kinase family protein [Haloarcula sp. CGMCC 1.6347]|uniref:diacylglycerol/lipid kinase family protein n=1 Tax=Haloarcula sp. CGMCC 1.6347 TaxID=3111455 RepID=UPI00300F0A2B
MSGTVLIYNPRSGSGDHGDAVRERAAAHEYDIEETEAAGDAVSLAEAAAETGYETIVAAGGDGTINEVIRGIDQADALDSVTLGVLPLGTGNNFAQQLGITDIDTAFDVLTDGERRRIDLGQASDRPFVNSCVAGLTAESSSETSPAMKDRLGVLAYVVTGLRSMSDFDSLRLTIDPADDDQSAAWAGEAICVLIGNGRRFTTTGGEQADMEDGLLDIVVIKDVSTLDLMSDRITERLLGSDSEHIIRSKASSLTITNHDPSTVSFSLDGEIISHRELTIDVRPDTLSVAVGDGYDPDPE